MAEQPGIGPAAVSGQESDGVTIESVYLGSTDFNREACQGKDAVASAIDDTILSMISEGNANANPCTISLSSNRDRVSVTRAWSESILWICPLSHVLSCWQGSIKTTEHCFAVIQGRKSQKSQTCHVFSEATAAKAMESLGLVVSSFQKQPKMESSESPPRSVSVSALSSLGPGTANAVAAMRTKKKNRGSKSPTPGRRGSTTSRVSHHSSVASQLPGKLMLDMLVGAGRGITAMKSDNTYSNLQVRILGLAKERLGNTMTVKSNAQGFALWNSRFSVLLPFDIARQPRPYVTMQLWGKEGGSTESLIGESRLLVGTGTEAHSENGAWISFHRGSLVWASIRVHLGWREGGSLEVAPLPSLRGVLPSESAELLYGNVQIPANEYQYRVRTVVAGTKKLSTVGPVAPGVSGGEVELSLPPRCEPVLYMLPAAEIGDLKVVFILTRYRILLVPIFNFMLQYLFNDIISERVPSHLIVKRKLTEKFGEEAVTKYKEYITEILERLTHVGPKREKGFSCQHSYCGRDCCWTIFKPKSIPIAGVFKIELDDKILADQKTLTQKLLDDGSSEILRLQGQKDIKVAHMTIHCKACRSFRVTISNGGVKEHLKPNNFDKFSLSMTPLDQARQILGTAQQIREEAEWLMVEGNFATSMIYHAQCQKQTDGTCLCHSETQLGVFGFDFVNENPMDRTWTDDDAAEASEKSSQLVPEWQNDEDAAHCVYCNEAFTFLRRRHHCRLCGIVVCDHCSRYKLPFPGGVPGKTTDKVRACVGCYHESSTSRGDDDIFVNKSKALKLAQEAWESEKSRFKAIVSDSSGERNALPWWSSVHEYSRMKELWKVKWAVEEFNADYKVCSTYPKLFGLPMDFDKSMISGVAKFRSKGRIPILSWIHPRSRAPLCRCSQPMTGITGHISEDDVALMQAIRSTLSIDQDLKIFDARPKLNAMANQLKGKGYERVNHYGGGDNVTLEFLDIANIHVVRSSMVALVKACSEEIDNDMFAGIGSSQWMSHLSSILRGATSIVDALIKSQACVVHCSDGWDRTSQLSSLSQIMLDPTCRTIKGFCRLVEKEWCNTGHMFGKRCGEFGKDFEQGDSSPVFVQWLDAIQQIAWQFPNSFEFNERMLIDTVDAVYSEWFGTFSTNSEKERTTRLTTETTISFWEFVLSNRKKYENVLYLPPNPLLKDRVKPLLPNPNVAALTLWRGMYRQSTTGPDSNTGGPRETALVAMVQAQQKYIQSLIQTTTSDEPQSPQSRPPRPIKSPPSNRTGTSPETV